MSIINLLEGKFQCCGVLCPKQEAQEHIDKMQECINLTARSMSGVHTGYHERSRLAKLVEQLKEETVNETNTTSA